MMILPDYEKLYERYSADASLNQTITWMCKQAVQFSIPDEIRDAAISETFLEMGRGLKFPIGICNCGCDFPTKWSCVAQNHYMLNKMLEMQDIRVKQLAELIQDRTHAKMLFIIKEQNREYTKKHITPWYRRIFADWIGNMIEGS